MKVESVKLQLRSDRSDSENRGHVLRQHDPDPGRGGGGRAGLAHASGPTPPPRLIN